MRQITEITSEPRQQHLLPVAGEANATLTLEFRPDVFAWFFTLTWGTFEVANAQLVACPNALRQYSKILPIGLCCDTTTGQDPMALDAFVSGAAVLYLLDADEIGEVETLLYG